MKKTLFIVAAAAAVAIPMAAIALTSNGAEKASAPAGIASGLEVGEMVTPFHPMHVSGPDKGTDTCPPCKYGNRPAVQAWVVNDSVENAEAIAKHLNASVAKNESADLKGFMIMLTRGDACVTACKDIAAKAEKSQMNKIGIAHLPATDDAVKNYKVNTGTDVKNTIFVYQNRKVVAKFVNLKADKEGLAKLDAAIAQITK